MTLHRHACAFCVALHALAHERRERRLLDAARDLLGEHVQAEHERVAFLSRAFMRAAGLPCR